MFPDCSLNVFSGVQALLGLEQFEEAVYAFDRAAVLGYKPADIHDWKVRLHHFLHPPLHPLSTPLFAPIASTIGTSYP